MATPDGPRADHLTHFARLTATPESHHIFAALRIIEAQYPAAPRMGRSRRPREDAVRLGQEPRMAFPPSTISGFRAPGGEPGRLTNLFFGMFGPHGPLPAHLTEYARERMINRRDPSFVAFADMLTHRLMSLMYRAWVTGQPAVDFDRGGTAAFSNHVAALAGLHGAAFQGRDAMPDLAKRHFSGLLGTSVKNAEGLLAILSAFLKVPVRIQELVGCWLALEPEDQWQLGRRDGLGQGGGLGRTSSLGARVWSRSAKFRLIVGPVGRADYDRLLPGQPTMDRLAAIVRGYGGDTLDYDVNVVLRAADVPRASLGQGTALGHTSWLAARRTASDAADLYLEPQQQKHRAA
ncbi:type VI secretion system baseplate subunit TssG [Loktanella sp. M215]|uniref:type VI secretion system baseplate subunit TssG n=1 Tax=Loktanella sp. M215 TaxID=2675431 RepID=UPI001F02E6EA|nr:type VI secretion system baseplate subunit TssG [Loktanella sp. M215]MCF7699896.1 type VI secretion system baseplate subunit TssG [Loktanella sp. M215]